MSICRLDLQICLIQLRVAILLKLCSVSSVLKSAIIVRHSCSRASYKGVPYVNVEVDVNAFVVRITLHANVKT